ncbi:MAG: acetyltransferase [Candidatus Eremiobacter antarcticus]
MSADKQADRNNAPNGDIVLWGGTGQAKVLAEFLGALGYRLVAIFDNNKSLRSLIKGVPLYHGFDGFRNWRATSDNPNVSFSIAIGGARGRDRSELQRRLEAEGLTAATLAHPTAFVAGSAKVGPGSQILALACVGAEATLGRAVIVNGRAGVDHDAVLEDGVHIGPGATLAGGVHVGECSLVGAGAVVLPNVTIGPDVIVGAGAVVTKDVGPGLVVYGNPATARRSLAASR